VIDDFLKLSGGFLALSRRQIRLAPNVGRIKTGNVVDELNLA
jgi:hypothetical protein